MFVFNCALLVSILCNEYGALYYLISLYYAVGGLEDVEESIGPFLEGYGCDEDLISMACNVVTACASGGGTSSSNGDNDAVTINGGSGGALPGAGSSSANDDSGAVRLKQGLVSMASGLSEQTDAEIDANRYMWGQEK